MKPIMRKFFFILLIILPLSLVTGCVSFGTYESAIQHIDYGISNENYTFAVRYHRYISALEARNWGIHTNGGEGTDEERIEHLAITNAKLLAAKNLLLKELKAEFQIATADNHLDYAAGIALIIRKLQYSGELMAIEDALKQDKDPYAKYLATYTMKNVAIFIANFNSGRVIYDLGMGTEGHLFVKKPEDFARLAKQHKSTVIDLDFSAVIAGKFDQEAYDKLDIESSALRSVAKKIKKKAECKGGGLKTVWVSRQRTVMVTKNGKTSLQTSTTTRPETSGKKCGKLNTRQKSRVGSMNKSAEELFTQMNKAKDIRDTGTVQVVFSAPNKPSTAIAFELSIKDGKNKNDDDVLFAFFLENHLIYDTMKKYVTPKESVLRTIETRKLIFRGKPESFFNYTDLEAKNIIWLYHAKRLMDIPHKGYSKGILDGPFIIEEHLRYGLHFDAEHAIMLCPSNCDTNFNTHILNYN